MDAVLIDAANVVTSLGFAAFALLLLALPVAFWSVSSRETSMSVRSLVAMANLLLTAQLVLRWWQSGHFPISNLYESLCFLAWACTLTQLLVERWPSPHVATVHRWVWVHRFCKFCLARYAPEFSALGPCASIELVGDARQRDHGELCRAACGVVVVVGCSLNRSKRGVSAEE